MMLEDEELPYSPCWWQPPLRELLPESQGCCPATESQCQHNNGTFDFDELDDLEAGKSEALERRPAPAERKLDLANDRKRLSRARAWFEIRRFFEAEPQKYYGSHDRHEWKIYYAKELILKTACERLQQDGYVVIDAQMAPSYLARLACKLLLDAPEQAWELRDHVPLEAPAQAKALKDQFHAELLARHCQRELSESESVEATHILAVKDAFGLDRVRPQPLHEKLLCESCLVSLDHNNEPGSKLRPRNMQQFLQFLRTFLHEVATNSMASDKGSDKNRVPVQFCFGDFERPERAILEPPAKRAIASDVQF